MGSIVANSRQTTTDLVLESYGSIERLNEFARENNIAITDDLTTGQELEFNEQDPEDKETKSYLNRNNIHPASQGEAIQGGIGYMQIETNFIVS